MSEKFAYVIINPYTIVKSRTGGVIARLLSRSSAELVAARMFAPSKQLIDEYTKTIGSAVPDQYPEVRELFLQYINENYAPDKNTGLRKRVMFLLFKGEDAVNKLSNEVVGHVTRETVAGETIRDTYGDYIKNSDGKVKYFEPAVLMSTRSETAAKELDVWVKYSDTDSGVLENTIRYKSGVNPESTLVLIKPDCFQWPSGRAGNIIDMFSKTGLYIIAVKVARISVSQAEEFYAPVRQSLLKKFNDDDKANEQFNSIIKFMTGFDPVKISSQEDKETPGKVKCLALIYQGEDAVRKIRTVLGTTDPSKAEPATVRKEFGKDIMVNTAHASDSVENAVREIGILKIGRNDLKETVEEFYKNE